MKLFLSVLFTVLSVISVDSANAYYVNGDLLEGSSYYRLSCTYQYEDEYKGVLNRSFQVYSNPDVDGAVRFMANKANLPAFYFQMENRVPTGVWHNNSSFQFFLVVGEGEISYHFSFTNYVHSRKTKEVLFSEARRLHAGNLDDLGIIRFNYEDGKVLESRTDERPWVNEKGVTIKGCTIESFGSGGFPLRRTFFLQRA